MNINDKIINLKEYQFDIEENDMNNLLNEIKNEKFKNNFKLTCYEVGCKYLIKVLHDGIILQGNKYWLKYPYTKLFTDIIYELYDKYNCKEMPFKSTNENITILDDEIINLLKKYKCKKISARLVKIPNTEYNLKKYPMGVIAYEEWEYRHYTGEWRKIIFHCGKNFEDIKDYHRILFKINNDKLSLLTKEKLEKSLLKKIYKKYK